MIYLVLPNRFINQILLALALTVGDMTITLATNYGSLSTLLTVYLNYTLANVIAFLSAWQVHSYRRRSYQEFINNKKAQAALEQQTKNLEQLVAERTEKLKNAERLAAIGATAGMVGHDIRNPLTAITGAIYMANKRLKGLPDSPEKVNLKENLDLISDETLYVNKIVADLQDYARPLDPEIGATNLGELLGSVFASLKVPENVHVERLIELNFPSLKTDSSYLRRIMANLCNNALQAMPNGGSLTVKATCSSDTVQISVADTGFGIPEKARDKLFTPLFTTKSKGQGFGLAVVKRMVEALGGKVTFETELGKGTTFHVELPR